jgi:hypothetical protein
VAEAPDESREEAAAVTERGVEAGDAQILVCHDGSNDSERAVDAAASLLGPRRAFVPPHTNGTV